MVDQAPSPTPVSTGVPEILIEWTAWPDSPASEPRMTTAETTMIKIHPTAIVDSSADLDEGVEIGPYCVVGPNVRIGRGTRLHNHVSVSGPTTIGRDNVLYPFSVVGADPQDLKFFGEHAVCLIGDRNVIREHVTIHRGTQNGGGVTRVGSDNLLMVSAHIAHDCTVGSHCVIANQVMVAGHVVIQDYVNIGGGVGIHHFVTVHQFAFIGGLTRIKKDIPPYMVIDGDPAEVRGVNVVGLTRRKFSAEEIAALKDACKRLFLHRQQPANGSRRGATGSPDGGPTTPEAARAAGMPTGWESLAAAMHTNGKSNGCHHDGFEHADAPTVTTIAPPTHAMIERENGSENGSPSNGTYSGDSAASQGNGNSVSAVINELVEQYGHLDCMQHLCGALIASAQGVHGRSLERRRHDSKYRPVDKQAPVANGVVAVSRD